MTTAYDAARQALQPYTPDAHTADRVAAAVVAAVTAVVDEYSPSSLDFLATDVPTASRAMLVEDVRRQLSLTEIVPTGVEVAVKAAARALKHGGGH